MPSVTIQNFILGVYRNPVVRRFLRTRIGIRIFVSCYDIYKNHIEAVGNHALSARIPDNTWVIDVGANIGFFTERFLRWVSGDGRVIAIEPEPENLAILNARLARQGLTAAIVQAVATDHGGTVYLQRNPEHPGDHRIGASGEEVAAVTIDDLVEQAGSPTIGLIKIDTQGSEQRVLAGASRTLQRCRPNLYIEVDDGALRNNGTNAAELIRGLDAAGYQFFKISSLGREVPIEPATISEELISDKRGYLDVLCVQKAR